jgi:hypothetical protein
MAVYNSEGCVGRCDARCYGAHHAKCTCICGGRNHSAGKQRALENMDELGAQASDLLELFAKKREFKCEELTVINRLIWSNAKHARHEAYMLLNQKEFWPDANRGPVPQWQQSSD